ncbi:MULTISPECIES: (Na+)-NQR maturation NqrM [unclassified Moritella]|uniref:(Na+)-NQR maturation NqrM n=1 Tax=unclassified Moritella TaxID=2637987 RepID=UPI001BA8C39E|nr:MULTISPECIES: (Na+)-NQR maturation NqrM [unclassified Moritella]QUM86518.1 (Na+)-NQR maturation NqrM [Moritella sp. 28]QUM90744.1 (Na+)-NQR maturation NqrM [Moritella sp. 36]
MAYFAATFVMFALVIAGMSIGYIVQKKSITGSCGGISNLGMEKACDCPDPCDKRKAKMAKEEAKQKMLHENRII